MPRQLLPDNARLVTSACLGAISGPDGPTDEQLAVLRCVVSHLWGLPDLDLSQVTAFTAAQTGEGITDPVLRRRTRELMVLLEMCRHPLEESHTRRVEDYCYAMGEDGPGIAIMRGYVTEGAETAMNDWLRRFLDVAPEMMEPEMVGLSTKDEDQAAQRFAELEAALRAAGPGTLGAELTAFYDRAGFTLGPGSIPLFGHDIAHVIAGYDATPIGEICLGAMKLMITDSDVHWIEFLGNVMIHETGILFPGYVPHEPAFRDPAALEMLGRALERGQATERDFSVGEHLSMIDWPLEDVRAHYGVAPL